MRAIYFEHSERLSSLMEAFVNREPFESISEKIKPFTEYMKDETLRRFFVFVHDTAEAFCDRECFKKIFDLLKSYGVAFDFFRLADRDIFYDNIYWLNQYLSEDGEKKESALNLLGLYNHVYKSDYQSYEQLFPFFMLGDRPVIERVFNHTQKYIEQAQIFVYYELRKRRTEKAAMVCEFSGRLDYKKAIMLACEDPEFFYDVVQYEFRQYLPVEIFNPDGSVKKIEENIKYIFCHNNGFNGSLKASRVWYLYKNISENGFRNVKPYLPKISLLNARCIEEMTEHKEFSELINELAEKEIFFCCTGNFGYDINDVRCAEKLLPKRVFYIDENFIKTEYTVAGITKWLKFCSKKNVHIWTRSEGSIFSDIKIRTSRNLAEAYFRAGTVYSECYDEVIAKAVEEKALEMMNMLCEHNADIKEYHVHTKKFPDDFLEDSPEEVIVCTDKPATV